MSYGPTRGKLGVFGVREKNLAARDAQAQLSGNKSKYAFQNFRPVSRDRKRGMFRDKNYEIQRRRERESNLQDWMADIKSQFGGQAQIDRKGSNVTVTSEFQKFQYMDDPMGWGDIQLKDVEAFVPEGFTKVKTDTGFKITSGPKKYTTRYKRKKGKSSRKDYGT